MSEEVTLPLDEVRRISIDVLKAGGLSDDHAHAIAEVVYAGQRDECHSHGMYRLLGCVRSVKEGKVNPKAVPDVVDHAPAVVRVDAHFGFSPLAFERGKPLLVEKARRTGLAAMAINNCYHFSALWPEVEAISADGLVALAMTPSHSWVAPAGGTKPVFGTNPIAFAWPRPDGPPFVFDFATSAIARGEIELHRRAGKPIPAGWAVDRDGQSHQRCGGGSGGRHADLRRPQGLGALGHDRADGRPSDRRHDERGIHGLRRRRRRRPLPWRTDPRLRSQGVPRRRCRAARGPRRNDVRGDHRTGRAPALAAPL